MAALSGSTRPLSVPDPATTAVSMVAAVTTAQRVTVAVTIVAGTIARRAAVAVMVSGS